MKQIKSNHLLIDIFYSTFSKCDLIIVYYIVQFLYVHVYVFPSFFYFVRSKKTLLTLHRFNNRGRLKSKFIGTLKKNRENYTLNTCTTDRLSDLF